MTRLLATAGSAALLLALATTAQAQAQDWSGPYVGVSAGYVAQDSDSSESIRFDTDLDGRFGDQVNTTTPANAFSPGFCDGAANTNAPAGGCDDDDDSGFDGGIRAGYDWQMGSWVFGIVGEADFVDQSDSVSAFSVTPASYTMTREVNAVYALRGRVGYAFDNVLGYVTGGLAMADVDHSFATTNVVNTFVETEGDDPDGYQLGVGAEMRLADSNWSVGAEYLYTNHDDGDYRVRAQGPAAPGNAFLLVNAAGTDFARSQEDIELHSFRLTLAYRF